MFRRQEAGVFSPTCSGTSHGGTEPYKAILVVGRFSCTWALKTAYVGEYLYFRYLKRLIMLCKTIGNSSVNLRKDCLRQRFESIFIPKGKIIQFDEHAVS